MKKTYYDIVFEHYEKCWSATPNIYMWDRGPFEKLPHDFRVLEFAPNKKRDTWTYVTCGMSDLSFNVPIELHIFSGERDPSIIELLSVTTYYHRHSCNLDINHTINFGRPWQDKSSCEYGLISLPYLDGPSLENLEIGNRLVKVYWLIPVTKAEVDFKKNFGIDILEVKFDEASLDYINPNRKSVV